MVDQPAQRLEEGRQALHFVQYHQPVLPGTQILLDVAELAAVFGRFQVEVHAIGLRQPKSQRGFANLARPKKYDSWRINQCLLDFGGDKSAKCIAIMEYRC